MTIFMAQMKQTTTCENAVEMLIYFFQRVPKHIRTATKKIFVR